MFPALAVALLLFAAAPAAPVANPELVLSRAPPLTGNLTSCDDITASACTGGLAAYRARTRALERQGVTFIAFSEVDRSSVFSKLHPLEWGVNLALAGRFQFRALFSLIAFVTPAPEVAFQERVLPIPNVIDNVDFAVGHPLRSITGNALVDAKTGVAVITVRTDYQGLDPTVLQVKRTLAGLATASAVRHTVLLAYDTTAAALLTSLRAAGGPAPTAVIDVVGRSDTHAPRLDGATWTAAFTLSAAAATRLRLLTNATGHCSGLDVVHETLAPLPAALQDANYTADKTHLRSLAQLASANNPVVGHTAAAMPASLTADKAGTLCLVGECELGTLFADAVRWGTQADVAFHDSHSVRGPGWPAGNVTLLDLYAAFPYTNTLCHARVTGLSLVEIANASLVEETFRADAPAVHGKYLQWSGARITYDMTREPRRRLVNLEVWNSTAARYAPVDRHHLYTVATNSYACSAWRPYSEMLAARYTGESRRVITADDEHKAVGRYMQQVLGRGFVPTKSGRAVVSTLATAPAMSDTWVHTAEGCTGNTVFRSHLASCVECPAGTAPDSLRATCVSVATPSPPSASSSSGLPVVVVVVIAAAGAALLAAFIALLMWQCFAAPTARDHSNAPVDEEKPFAVVFTDIQASTTLWGRVPADMSEAVEQHHELIRQLISKHHGYEVKTIGDAFMVAFKDPVHAVRFSLAVQETFYDAEWNAGSEELDIVYRDLVQDTCSVYGQLWNGLRIRIGVNYGLGRIAHDPTTLGYDYYGTVVNTAARVEAASHGGQTTITQAVLDAITLTTAQGVVLTALGAQMLRGLDDEVFLHQLLPTRLSMRTFPALRLELANSIEDEATPQAKDMSGSERSVSHYGETESVSVRDSVPAPLTDPSALLVSALFATMRPKAKAEMVQALAKAWQVSAPPLARLIARPSSVDGVLGDVVSKANRATCMAHGISPLGPLVQPEQCAHSPAPSLVPDSVSTLRRGDSSDYD